VPLIEAFHMGIPVIAYAATAVPATMDGGGLLVTTKEAMSVAALVNELVTDAALQDRVLVSQEAALDRLAARDFGGTLLHFVTQVQQRPRMARSAVAPDFWQQVALAQKLSEIRTFRPAAFMALPPPPDGRHVHEDREGHEDHEDHLSEGLKAK
jgi:hypothetical protein